MSRKEAVFRRSVTNVDGVKLGSSSCASRLSRNEGFSGTAVLVLRIVEDEVVLATLPVRVSFESVVDVEGRDLRL
jgi:hypothetical protein